MRSTHGCTRSNGGQEIEHAHPQVGRAGMFVLQATDAGDIRLRFAYLHHRKLISAGRSESAVNLVMNWPDSVQTSRTRSVDDRDCAACIRSGFHGQSSKILEVSWEGMVLSASVCRRPWYF